MLNQPSRGDESVQGVLPEQAEHAVRAEEQVGAQPASPFRFREAQQGTAVQGTPPKGVPHCRDCGAVAHVHAILNQLFCPVHGVIHNVDWQE